MQGPVIAIGVALVLALAGIGALIRFVAKGAKQGKARTAALAAAFVVAVLVLVAVAAYTSVYFSKPPLLIAAVLVLAAGAVGLFVLTGRSVAWAPSRVIALIGIVFVCQVLFAATAMSLSGFGVTPPFPYVTRARQMAEAEGFQVLLPPDEKMNTESLPIDQLPAPDEGLYVEYEGFQLQERKDGVGMATGTLEERAKAAIPPEGRLTKLTTVTVDGAQGVVAEFTVGAKAAPADVRAKLEQSTLLVFQRDGVDVRMLSIAGVRESDGNWVPFSNLTPDELVRIAQSMRAPE